jgi:hypothetical protein
MLDSITLKNKLGHCKTHAQKTVSKLLKTKKLNVCFQSDILKALLVHNPKQNICEIRSFSKRLMPPYNTPCLTILTKSNDVITVSWKTCIDKLYGCYNPERNKKQRILQAFREEIALSPKMLQAKGFYNVGACKGCGKIEKLQIDHDVKPFSQILDEFLIKKKLKLLSVKINFENKPYTLYNSQLSRDWVSWHDTHATLVGLCKTCNIAKGSSGYKHKR